MPRSFEAGFKARLRTEHEKADREWEPVGVGLLKESFSEHGTAPSRDTVGHDFGVVWCVMGKVDYCR